MILLLHYYHICHLLWIKYLYHFEVFTFTLIILVGVSSLNICMMFIFMYPKYYQLIWLCHTCINDKICIQWIDLSRQCRYYKYCYNNDTIYSLYMSIIYPIFALALSIPFFVVSCTWDKHICICQHKIILSSYMVPLWSLRKRITSKRLNITRTNWTLLSI